jgi:hypothetical protein
MSTTTSCPACGDSVAPLTDACSDLLGVLSRVPAQDDAALEQQLTDAIERCHIQLAIAQLCTTPPASTQVATVTLETRLAWWVNPLLAATPVIARIPGVNRRRLFRRVVAAAYRGIKVTTKGVTP